jgi:hypothetical protein
VRVEGPGPACWCLSRQPQVCLPAPIQQELWAEGVGVEGVGLGVGFRTG